MSASITQDGAITHDANLSDTLVQCSLDCVKILDRNGKVLLFNRNGLALMEIDDPATVEGVYWPLLWPAEARPTLEAALHDARTNGVAAFTAQCPTAKGTRKWWDVVVSSIPGPERRYVIVSRDITRQRELETAQREALERLNSIHMAGTDVLWDIDLERNRVWWSEGMQSVFGYGPEQIGDTTQWCHQHIHPEDRARVVEGMNAAVQNGDITWEDEFRYLKADGTYLDIHDRGTIMRDVSGRALRFVGVMQDNTRRTTDIAQHKIVSSELAHRLNNTLAVVSAIFQQTARSSGDMQTMVASFGKRLVALSTAFGAVARSKLNGADLRELADTQLAPFFAGTRLTIEGPQVSLSLDVAQSLSLALNELATNAVKYGALSNLNGTVSLSWNIRRRGTDQLLTIEWIEKGGPPVEPPTRAGLGSRLIESGIAGAHVTRNFPRSGFSCAIEMPVRSPVGEQTAGVLVG